MRSNPRAVAAFALGAALPALALLAWMMLGPPHGPGAAMLGALAAPVAILCTRSLAWACARRQESLALRRRVAEARGGFMARWPR